MEQKSFYNGNQTTASLEELVQDIQTFKEFESSVTLSFLADDTLLRDEIKNLVILCGKDLTQVSEMAGLTRSYLANLLDGKKDPTRDALIALCLSLGATLDETQHILNSAGFAPLFHRRLRDVIIWFGFVKKKTVIEVNEDLFDHGYPLLPKEKYVK